MHHRLGLPPECLVYDVSNACVGMLNGMVQVANMIELGRFAPGWSSAPRGAGNWSRPRSSSSTPTRSLSRADLKRAIASLTIGSGSAAVLLAHRELSRTQNRLIGAVGRAETRHHALCYSGRDESVAGDMRPLMETDSEQLMEAGIRAGAKTFAAFLREIGWRGEQIDKTFCHQVGTTHRKLMLAALGLDPRIDFPTFASLGNTGSVALPTAMALGIEAGHLRPNDRVALLGIGSGINVLMLAVEWQPQGKSR